MARAALPAHGYLIAASLQFAHKEDGLQRLALVAHVHRGDGLVLLSRDAAAQGAQRPALHALLHILPRRSRSKIGSLSLPSGPSRLAGHLSRLK